MSSLTHAEEVVLQQCRHLRLQGDGVTQQDVLTRHFALVAVVEAKAEPLLAGVSHDAAGVEVSVGRPLGHHAQAHEAAAVGAGVILGRAQGVGVGGQLAVARAAGKARGWQRAAKGLVL